MRTGLYLLAHMPFFLARILHTFCTGTWSNGDKLKVIPCNAGNYRAKLFVEFFGIFMIFVNVLKTLVVTPIGFEPITCPLGGGCSIQLSHGAMRNA